MTREEKAKKFFHNNTNGIYYEYDKNGFVNYYEYSNGIWCECLNNKDGYKIKTLDSSGSIIYRNYDEFNNKIFEHFEWLSDGDITFTNIIIK